MFNKNLKIPCCVIIWFCIILFFTNCNNSKLKYSIETKLNPNNIAPLSAEIFLTIDEQCKGSVTVLGKHPVSHNFETKEGVNIIPILGLYAGRLNTIVLNLNNNGKQLVDTIKISTNKLPDFIPSIEINKINRGAMEPGMHLCDLHYAKNGTYDSRPLIFDDEGEVRWYLDLSFFGDIIWPIQRIKNGSLLVAGQNKIFEFDMLGKVIKNYEIDPIYRIHHDIVEMPNGNWLMAVRRNDVFISYQGEKIPSWNDFIISFNPKTSKIEKEWDLAKHLDVSRRDLNYTIQTDWLHMNGLAFDPRDSSIIMSAKNQGLVKISWNDELKWILAPKKNWGKAGRNGEGPDTNPFLLTAIDSNGKPFRQPVQEGAVSPSNFDFPWGQHSPQILENGNIILYDNGYKRNFIPQMTYSRGVEYQINEKDMTVKQIWQYGKERKQEFYSMLISDVDYLPQSKNILITSGFIMHNSKIVEVSYPQGEEVFEATLYLKTLNGNKTFSWGQLDLLYRSERFKLEY